MSSPGTRQYSVRARSTDTFGRVLWSCRDQHFVADGPVWNGAPGEAVSPGELFLAGVAACGVELLQGIAKAEEVPLAAAAVEISAEIEPDNPVRRDVNVFNRVRLRFRLEGVSDEQAELLIDRFKKR